MKRKQFKVNFIVIKNFEDRYRIGTLRAE